MNPIEQEVTIEQLQALTAVLSTPGAVEPEHLTALAALAHELASRLKPDR